jgi:hypothetical protein
MACQRWKEPLDVIAINLHDHPPLDPQQFALPEPIPRSPLNDSTVKELFGDSDPMLLGNRIAALTTALGIPPCGGCSKRQEWLNAAHRWLRGE